MGVRRVVVPALIAAILLIFSVRGHAFNLSQMLGGGEEQDLNTFKLIHVADLKAMLAKHSSAVHLYDANSEVTRQKFGTIPGATLLASADEYPLTVLPSNKHATLIFYCADSH
jgi:hypothetical protein